MCAGCRPAQPLLQIAATFSRGAIDVDAVEEDLCALAACALAGRCAGPEGQISLLGSAMEPFTLSDNQVGIDDLLLHRVLARWSGAPAILCAVAAEAGARAGLDVAIAGDGTRHVLVHRGGRELAWDPATGVRALGAEEQRDLRLRCGHQLAFTVLATIVERATRGGDLSVALHATDLRLRLPLAAPLRARVEAERAGLMAALN
jgi:hypothetical protein